VCVVIILKSTFLAVVKATMDLELFGLGKMRGIS
jgi:hypothetical protein